MAKVDNPNERVLGNHNLIVTSYLDEEQIHTITFNITNSAYGTIKLLSDPLIPAVVSGVSYPVSTEQVTIDIDTTRPNYIIESIDIDGISEPLQDQHSVTLDIIVLNDKIINVKFSTI